MRRLPMAPPHAVENGMLLSRMISVPSGQHLRAKIDYFLLFLNVNPSLVGGGFSSLLVNGTPYYVGPIYEWAS